MAAVRYPSGPDINGFTPFNDAFADAMHKVYAEYRADLGLDKAVARSFRHPRNVWSLHGLRKYPVQRGDTSEVPLSRQMLDQALARASIPIKASCYYRKTCAAG